MNSILLKLHLLGLWIQAPNIPIGGIYLPFDFVSFEEENKIVLYSSEKEIIHSGPYICEDTSILIVDFIKFSSAIAIDSNVITCNIAAPYEDPEFDRHDPVKIKLIRLTPTKVSIPAIDAVLNYTWYCKEEKYPFGRNGINLELAENDGPKEALSFIIDHIGDYWFFRVLNNKVPTWVLPIISIDKNEINVFQARAERILTLYHFD